MSAKQTTRAFDLDYLCDRNSLSPRNGVQDNQDNESAVGKMTVSNPAQTVFNPEQKFIFGDWIHHSSRRSIRRKRAVTPVFDDSEVEEFEEYSPQLKSKKRKTSKPSKKYIVPQAEGGRKRPESFEKRVEELLEYKKVYGHTNVSRGDPVEWMSLAHWVNNQRAAKKIGHLKEDRIRKLEDIGFLWEMRPPRKYHANPECSPSDITPPNHSDASDGASASETEGSTTEEEDLVVKASPPSSPSSGVSDCPALSEIEEFFVHEFATHKFWQKKCDRLPI